MNDDGKAEEKRLFDLLSTVHIRKGEREIEGGGGGGKR